MKSGITMYKIYRESVSLYYTYKGNSWRMSLGIQLSEFDKRRKEEIRKALKAKQDLSEFFPEEWNSISSIKQKVDGEIQDFLKSNGRKPSIEELKRLVASIRYSPVQVKEDEINLSSNLLRVFDSYIEDRMKLVKSKRRSIHTNKDVFTFKNTIIDFQKNLKREFIIRDITKEWMSDLFDFFIDVREKSDGYLTQGNLVKKTIKKRFDTLKNFAMWLENKNIHIHNWVKSEVKEILDSRIEPMKVIRYALNDEQLKLIREVELDEESPKCKARDMFIVVCYTGMRFGDLITLRKHHIAMVEGTPILKRIARKTLRKEYEVELHPYVKAIMEKYDFNMNLMTNAKANQYIKEVLAGIDDFCVEITDYQDRFNRPSKLWELISFHQGRRTFITNLFKKGLTAYEVMVRTDHKKIQTLEEYVSKSKENYQNPNHLFGF
jgi:integrase